LKRVHVPCSRAQVSSGSKKLHIGGADREFVDEGGASPNWLFVAPTELTHSKRAIVKVCARCVRLRGTEGPRGLGEVVACNAEGAVRGHSFKKRLGFRV
jgi:hypothetical protein